MEREAGLYHAGQQVVRRGKQEVKTYMIISFHIFIRRMDSKKRKNMQRNGLTICKRHIIGITIWYITIFLHG